MTLSSRTTADRLRTAPASRQTQALKAATLPSRKTVAASGKRQRLPADEPLPVLPTLPVVPEPSSRTQILAAHQQGLTVGEMAQSIGVSPQRVRQILDSEQLVPHRAREKQRAEVRRRLEAGEGVPAVAREMGIAPSTVRARAKASGMTWPMSRSRQRLQEMERNIQAHQDIQRITDGAPYQMARTKRLRTTVDRTRKMTRRGDPRRADVGASLNPGALRTAQREAVS